MKRKGWRILLILFLYPLWVNAQNLVPNPSFEAYNNCPNSVPVGGIYYPNIAYSLNYDSFPTVKAWISPIPNSPDYFNICDTIINCDRSIPANAFGYQYPHTGNAYAGIYMFDFVPHVETKDYREYIESKLLQPMIAGHTYDVSFYVSFTASSCNSGTVVSVDKIGAYFSDTLVHDTIYIPDIYLNLAPSIESAPGWFISDTINWTKIEGTYTAHGGEQWITLGHFNDGQPLDDSVLYTITVGFPNDSFLYCYMYMDDVCVMDMTNNTNSSNVCASELPVSISGINDTGAYLWNTGDTTATLTVNKAGTYWRVVKGDCLYYTDTITVTQKPYVHLGNDTAVCKEALFTIGQQENGVSYLWNTGDTSCCITPAVSGVYTLQAYNACGTAADSIMINMFYPCEQCLFVPDAFTPNGDGRNDLFEIKARCPMKDYHLRVYDRYGQLVFSSVQTDYSWNGEYKGNPMDVGVYYYYIEYTPALPAATRQIIKGNVTLVK